MTKFAITLVEPTNCLSIAYHWVYLSTKFRADRD